MRAVEVAEMDFDLADDQRIGLRGDLQGVDKGGQKIA